TRITTQVEGKRNYHVFYQMFSGADEAALKKFGLADGIAAFRYIHREPGDAEESTGRRGLRGDAGVPRSDRAEKDVVLSVVAVVLHVGNVGFEKDTGDDGHSTGDKAQMTASSADSLATACALLGLDEAKVSEAMLTKLLSVGGETIDKPEGVAQASNKRDAFAKLVYSSLFVWLVRKVNATLASEAEGDATSSSSSSPAANGDGEVFSPPPRAYRGPPRPSGFIGVLDIYGFENFDANGFEQLLINYANEKLQRHFNRHLFEVEQSLYSSEGVDWMYITFNDNRPCLDLIEGGGGGGNVGILSTLDDCGGMGTASERDVNFLAQIHEKFGGGKNSGSGGGSVSSNPKKKKKNKGKNSPMKGPTKHPNFITPKFGKDRDFVVVHYAGEVRYTVKGFVEKNVETLSNELKDLGSSSTKDLIRDVFVAAGSPASALDSPPTGTPARRSAIRGVSVASQFRTSLQMLVMDLECTQPHYVRCIKPNGSKAYGVFDSGEVLRQLRYSGMMETIRIRREGYALREEHESFHRRFHLLLSTEEAKKGDGIGHLVNVLSKRLSLTDAEWQIGHTKIFLKRDLASKLEVLAHLRVRAAARVVGRFCRGVAHDRAGCLLTAWGRLRLILMRKRRKIAAANKIASIRRMLRRRRSYRNALRSIVRLQCLGRRIVAVEKVRVLRDPYFDMTFKELDVLYNDEVARMESAVSAKDFNTAAKIEQKLVPLKEALESKRPLTRSVLESRIAEVQSLVDDAVARKAFTECAPLQEKLEALIQKRADLPTLDELREAVCRAEKDVADAAARRDFTGAASAQAALDKAHERLDDALRSEGADADIGESTENDNTDSRFQSRADLELAISEATKCINDAIAKKEFSKASQHQAELEELESLRPTLPSLEELETQLNKVKQEMEEAIRKKNFQKADSLHKDVDKLEAKLEEEKSKMPSSTEEAAPENALPQFTNEKGENLIFECRYQLQEEIDRYKSLVQNAINSKKFKEASQHQQSLDKLEEMKPLLPTVEELKSELLKAKAEMDTAIQSKDFEKAEDLHKVVEELEKKFQLEQNNTMQPLAQPAPEPPKAPAVVSASYKTPLKERTNIKAVTAPSVSKSSKKMASASGRPVSKLRPKAPMTSQSDDSVLAVTQMLASKRGDAAIIVGPDGGLAGIITDTDVTRRVVAKQLPASATCVADVMTANPSCVAMSDPATDALVTMVENRFRHLPVTDDKGAVVGVLDIAKCLNDAISKLERSQDKGSNAAEEALKASIGGAGGAQAAALQQLLGPLLSQAFSGQSSPTLRTVLAGKPSTIVSPTDTVQETGNRMAEARKAALVVNNGQLVGIFGFKDMMSRVVAKELPLDFTAVSTVMTPNPESVSPDTTVLEALQIMHDNKFLTLPVCEANGAVVGIVDVMDCVYASGGADGWRSIFASAMECDDTASVGSRSHKSGSVHHSVRSSRPSRKNDMPVSKLRPKAPMISASSDTVVSVAQMLASKRGDAAIVTDSSGGLAGIITDTDVTRRVVAKNLPASTTCVADVMTANPSCVSKTDSATDAMITMIENRFRHLPVTDESGAVIGVLDIAKCLNDAISKLERSQEKGNNAAEEALKASLGGAGGAQAAALQQLLGPLLSQAFNGKSSPTLRTVLAGKPSTIVSPTTTIQRTGNMMAEARKAALVVDGGRLVGIFGFKDMMTRAIAKELPLDYTAVSTVMTPNPESVSPDTTVLEALQIMHENKFLTLPVCEANGAVVGIVDVMDCVYASGGADGWRSIFASAMECDDLTDTASIHSHLSGSVNQSVKSSRSSRKNDTPVSKLRPKAPMISASSGDAAIITDSSGGLAGIITDTDVTRRVVAKKLPASTTCVADVMTANPSCVAMSDSAADALVTMVENRFRHLPVTDDSGSIVGVLDIAKCLNDAISKLERSQEKGSNAAQEALKSSLAGAGGAQAAALQQLLGPLLSQAFQGKSSPTLRSVLAGKPSTVVSPTSSLQDVGALMAEARKAALVVDSGRLVGIFGFKDMMTRAVAKELPLDVTAVSTVMTPNPEAVSPETTVLEALQIMHDNKFLTLPVCEENGGVVGIVDVMDCVYASGGADGWKSIFASAMECDDVTETASVHSHRSASVHSHRSASVRSAKISRKKDERPVSKLRPKKPILQGSSETVLSVSKILASKRGDAALIVNADGGLAGIITDTDVTRRVVAKQLPAGSTYVSSVMTANPTCVSMSDSAMEALVTMVENRFRHLPVTDDNGGVVGCLDIAKCLNDAISKLERAQEKSGASAEDAMAQVASLQNAGGGNQGAALQALLGPLLAQALGGNSSPTLRSVLAGKPSTIVSPNSTLQTVGLMMAEARKAALIVDNGQLVGIFGFKDMMTRVVAKELPLDSTFVSDVMTPNPESVSPETTVVEALQIMHDNKFLTLPVCEDDGRVVGLVDVMDCVYASGGAEGWKSLFDSALDQDDVSSVYSAGDASRKHPPVMVTSHPNNIPLHVDVANSGDQESIGESLTLHQPAVASPKTARSSVAGNNLIAYKVVDDDGHTYVIRAGKSVDSIIQALEGKVSNLDPATTVFKYFDDEGDEIIVKSDECVEEAVRSSAQAGNKNVKLSMKISKSSWDNNTLLLAGGAGVVAAVALVAYVLLKPKK
ncbi:hypothetical protein ACHAWF_014727, partial [Thalassiosira exigua]